MESMTVWRMAIILGLYVDTPSSSPSLFLFSAFLRVPMQELNCPVTIPSKKPLPCTNTPMTPSTPLQIAPSPRPNTAATKAAQCLPSGWPPPHRRATRDWRPSARQRPSLWALRAWCHHLRPGGVPSYHAPGTDILQTVAQSLRNLSLRLCQVNI